MISGTYENISEVDKSYLAGIIDGEGCIRIGKNIINPDHPLYTSCVEVTQVSKSFLEDLQTLWAGAGSIHQHAHAKGNQSDSYRWTISGKKSQDVLEAVLPYLRLKGNQAEGAIELERSKRRTGKSNRAKPSTKEEREYREYIKTRISDLNQGVL